MGKTLEYREGDDKLFFFDVTSKDNLTPGSVFAPHDLSLGQYIYFQLWRDLQDAAPIASYDNDPSGANVGISDISFAAGRVGVQILRADLLGSFDGEDFVDLIYTLMVREDPGGTDDPFTADDGIFRWRRRGILLP